MKKLLWVLWCITLFSLTACTGVESLNFGTRPSWTNENKIFARTYKVVAKELAIPTDESENAKIWLNDHSMENEEEMLSYQASSGARKSNDTVTVDDFLKYDEKEKMPIFDFTEIGTIDAFRAAQALKEVWDTEDIPLWGAVINDDDTGLVMFEFFEIFECRTIQLKLPMFYSREGHHGSVGDIKGLALLIVDKVPFNTSLMDQMNICEELTDLTCLSEIHMEYSDKYFPKVKKLTLIARNLTEVPDDGFVKELKDTKVSEIDFLDMEGKDVEPSMQSVSFFEQLKELDNIKRINGMDKEQFVIPMSDKVVEQLEEKKKSERAEELLKEFKEKLKDCKGIDTEDEEGTPALGNKLIVRIDDEYSVRSAIDGEDFQGIPADRLAVSYEEADTYLCVHPYHQMVGTYTNGAVGYKTYTMVITFDLKNGNLRAAKCIGVDNPPETITTYSNIPSLAASGSFFKDQAMEYVYTLL